MKKQTLFMIGLATLLASATQAYSQEQLAKSIQSPGRKRRGPPSSSNHTGRPQRAHPKDQGRPPSRLQHLRRGSHQYGGGGGHHGRAGEVDGRGRPELLQRMAGHHHQHRQRIPAEEVAEAPGNCPFGVRRCQKGTQGSQRQIQALSLDLSDIQKTLALDVTADGVKSVRSTVKSANWNYQSVNRTITSAIKELEKMAKALSPEAK